MKEYVKPTIECVELRAEERLAGSCPKPGGCTDDNPSDGTTTFFF